MDAGHSDLRRPDIVSPVRGTHTRTVREYEQTIEALKKENFDLKMKIFLLEENFSKHFNKCKESANSDQDNNTVQLFVQLKTELMTHTESLQNELSNKNELLQNALNEAEKFALELKTLQDQFELQNRQLTSHSELPSKQEIMLLKGQTEKLLSKNQHLSASLSEKDDDIQTLNTKIEELSNTNGALEAKVKKSSMALRGILYKYEKYVESIPKALRPVMQSAVQAAKDNREEDLRVAIRQYKTFLYQMKPTAVESCSNESSQSDEQFSLSKDHQERSANISGENRSTNTSSESLCVPENLSRGYSREDLENASYILKENEALKLEAEDNLKHIDHLTSTCNELEQISIHLQSEVTDAASIIKNLEEKVKEEKSKNCYSLPKMDSAVQTSIQWHALQSKVSAKFLGNAGQSNSIDELKEEILTMLLVIEQKDKEMADIVEQRLAKVENISNKKELTLTNLDMDYMAEKTELHDRLAKSSSVNNELIRHLRNLEAFMEKLLQCKNLDSSSIQELCETSDVYSQLTLCLDRTLKLSTVLNDHLSVCESSKIFDPCEFSIVQDLNQSDSKSAQVSDSSRLSLNTSSIHRGSQGRDNFQLHTQEPIQNAKGTGKRRLSYSTLQKSALDTIDSENIVFLGRSNNEDLILLLNDKGDPEDVLIRNSHDHPDINSPTFNRGAQLRRRCWDNTVENYLDKFYTAGQVHPNMVGEWYNRCPSSDSDIWSEPDRDVSLQRIGIDVQKSPVTQKSPRRSRVRDKRTTDELSSQRNESSSSFVKLHSWAKRRKCSDPSKSNYICKKCLTQSDEVSRDEKGVQYLQKTVNELSSKCSVWETQLQELGLQLDSKISMIETLSSEKLALFDNVTSLKQELSALMEDKKNWMLKEAETTSRLRKLCSENEDLKITMQTLDASVVESDKLCDRLSMELNDTKIQLSTLINKCSEYEERLSSNSRTAKEHATNFSIVVNEKDNLLKDIEVLFLEKNKLIKNIQIEKNNINILEKHNQTLNHQFNEQSKSIAILQASYEELESSKTSLRKEKEILEHNYTSASSTCIQLTTDMTKLEEALAESESKCANYVKDLNKSAARVKSVVESLVGVKARFTSNLFALNEVCKQYLQSGDGRIQGNEDLLLEKIPEAENQVEKLFEAIVTSSARLEDTIDFLAGQLSSLSSELERRKSDDASMKVALGSAMQKLNLQETENAKLRAEEQQIKDQIEHLQHSLEKSQSLNIEYESKVACSQQQLGIAQNDIQILKASGDHCRNLIEELRKALNDKEECLSETSLENMSSLQKECDLARNECMKYQDLVNVKDDEITKSQERIFNLQTQLNSILAEQKASCVGQSSKDGFKENFSVHEHVNLNASVRKSAENEDEVNESNDTSISSTVSEKDNEAQKKIRDVNKIKALKAKLSLTEKRIEILEKEKSNLREDLLAQVHGVRKSDDTTEIDTVQKQIKDLKENLEKKSVFIKELKGELFKTCNSLVDKQKEVDVLQHKLNKHKEDNSHKMAHDGVKTRYLDPLQVSTETNVQLLKKHKWELLQSILKQQKQFYERKNIHLGHFEKFQNHIERLCFLQMPPTLFKAESEPLLNVSSFSNICATEKCDRTLKSLEVELELDVEYLQNFKIFLKRFFIPVVLQTCQCSKDHSPNAGQSGGDDKKEIPVLTKTITCEESVKIECSTAINLEELSSYSESRQHPIEVSSDDRIFASASIVSNKLDSIEHALQNIKTALEEVSDAADSPVQKTPIISTARSLLQKITNEVNSLQETFVEVSNLNSSLKSLGVVNVNVPQINNQSDRESLLSEETITLSRSGSLSPMSFEGVFTTKSIKSGMQKKTEHDQEKNLSVNKIGSSEFPSKIAVAGGSQDSIFQRSHFSSPDLGIESDPNHESSAPEQAEKETSRNISSLSKSHGSGSKPRQWTTETTQHLSSIYSSVSKLPDKSSIDIRGGTLRAIGNLQEYECLKKEVQESLVGIASVLSRTLDGLQHVAKYTSPRKYFEYSTFKAIKDECGNVRACLEKATELVDNFWIASSPSMQELNTLIQQNQELQNALKMLEESYKKQECNFKETMDKLKSAEKHRENMEKKLSKKLIQTKKVIRNAERKLLEKESQSLSSIPSYPNEVPPS